MLEAVFFAGLAALGDLSPEKLGTAMMIVAALTAITAKGVRAQVQNRSRHDSSLTRNAGSLRVTTGLMGRFAAIAAVLGVATALLGIAGLRCESPLADDKRRVGGHGGRTQEQRRS